jgi:hypothetical protein
METRSEEKESELPKKKIFNGARLKKEEKEELRKIGGQP